MQLKSVFVILLLCSTQLLFGQLGKLDRANRLYEQLAFQPAINLYEQILNKDNNAEAAVKLADCYRLTNQPEKAAQWYESVVSSGQATPIQKLYLAQALMSNGKYEDAEKWFEEYAREVPDDVRGINGLESCRLVKEIQQDAFPCRIVNLSINSPKSEFGPSFYDDGILFVSDRDSTLGINRSHLWTGNPFLNIYHSKTGNQGRLKKPRKLATDLNGNFHEGPMSFDSLRTEMYFTRSNYVNQGFGRKVKKSKEGLVKLKIYHATRPDARGIWEFDEEGEFAYNNDEYSVGHPALARDGSFMLFASDMPEGSGGVDLYISYRETDGSWGIPINLGSDINTPGHEMFPFLHPDGSLYFASDGHPGLGGMDIFFATAEKEDGSLSWSSPTNMGAPLNSSRDDFGLIITEELQRGYFVSDRDGGYGGDDIYAFETESPKLLVKAYDRFTLMPLADVELELFESESPLQVKKSDPEGQGRFEIMRNMPYRVTGTLADYSPGAVDIPSYEGWLPAEIEVNMPMDPIGRIMLRGKVLSALDGQALPDAVVTMKDKSLGKDRTIVTDAEGQFTIPLDADRDYSFLATLADYLDDEEPVSTRGVEPPNELEVLLELGIRDIVGPNNGPIELKNIYYDLDKYYIRRDGAPDLEKLAVIMKRYPDMRIELSSHTDSRADDGYNMALSQNRANAALQYLADRGISKDRIEAIGRGESELKNQCADGVPCTEREHQRNRRTEFRILNYGRNIVSTEKEFIPVNTGQVANAVTASQIQQIEEELNAVTLPKRNGDPNEVTAPAEPIELPDENTVSQGSDESKNEVWFQSGVAYGVHLGSGSLASASKFNKYRQYGAVQYEPWEGRYLFVIGYFEDKAEAEDVLEDVISGGLTNAYLVVYTNGVRTN